MVTLQIYNSYSRIQGLSDSQHRSVKNMLSYTAGCYVSFYSGGRGPKRVSLLSKRGEFPTGLLKRVLLHMSTENITFVINDNTNKPKSVESLMPKLDYEPYMAQKHAVEVAIKRSRGCITMPTGTGKSLVIGLIIAKLNLKTLVVVPTLEIKRQLTEMLQGMLPHMQHIRIENIDCPELKKLKDFDCLIIDEGHHVAAKTYHKLNKTVWNSIYYRFFLTATPFRNDTEETLLFESIAGQVIYRLTYKDAVAANCIVPVESYYIEIPNKATNAYTWSEVYSELVANNVQRNHIIADLLLRLNKPVLCLVKEVSHGKTLSELTGVPFVCASDEASRKYIRQFSANEISAVIGTEGILGEGVDTKPCEYVIIAGLGKAKSAFMQKVGRAVRRYHGKESAKVIIFKDRSHKFLTRHFKSQCDILLEEYGIKPIKVDYEPKT